MDRLTVVDEIFLRTHRGMGTPIALQGLWRTSDAMEPALLQAIHRGLRLGPLGHRVAGPRVPGARRSWRPNTEAHLLDLLPNAASPSEATGPAGAIDPAMSGCVDETGWPTAPLDRCTAEDPAAPFERRDRISGDDHDSRSTSAGAESADGNGDSSRAARGRLDIGPLSESSILAWADALGDDLDPEFHPGWRLSAARLEDGGTVVALTCSHALADARGLIHAITTALRSLDPTAADAKSSTSPENPGSLPGSPAPVGERGCSTSSSDWADAASQWVTVFAGTARALHRRLRRPRVPRTLNSFDDVTGPGPISGGEAESASTRSDSTTGSSTTRRARPPSSDTSSDRHLRPLLLTFDAADWNTTATALGGTPNSLFIHLTANILWEHGFPNPTITASLPVDTRDEPRVDNDLAMTEIAVHRGDTPATVRDKARAAYQRRMSSPAGLPEEILQVVPDRLAYALSKGAGERDILCSNIGPFPDEVRKVGPHLCTRVAARAIHPAIATFPRTQLSGYLSQLDNSYTLALVGLTADHDSLPDSVRTACAAVGLHPRSW